MEEERARESKCARKSETREREGESGHALPLRCVSACGGAVSAGHGYRGVPLVLSKQRLRPELCRDGPVQVVVHSVHHRSFDALDLSLNSRGRGRECERGMRETVF